MEGANWVNLPTAKPSKHELGCSYKDVRRRESRRPRAVRKALNVLPEGELARVYLWWGDSHDEGGNVEG